MRSKTPYLLLLIAGLSACQQPSKEPTKIAPALSKNHLQGYPNGSPLVQGYGQYLTTLDTNDLSNGQTAMRELKQRFANQPPEVCDTGFMLFLSFHENLNGSDSNAKKFIGSVGLDTLAGAEFLGNPLDARQQKAQQKLWDNNFIVNEEEGMPYVTTGWRLLNKQFSRYVTAPMKAVLAQRTKEDREGFMNDAALIIDSRQLAERTIWWDRFLARYPHHIFYDRAKSAYNVLVYVMVLGSDNTPITEYDSSFVLTPYYDTVYRMIRDSFPDSRTNTVIKPFWQAIIARDSVTMKKIRDSVPAF